MLHAVSSMLIYYSKNIILYLFFLTKGNLMMLKRYFSHFPTQLNCNYRKCSLNVFKLIPAFIQIYCRMFGTENNIQVVTVNEKKKMSLK